jgi:hypothetical protein
MAVQKISHLELEQLREEIWRMEDAAEEAEADLSNAIDCGYSRRFLYRMSQRVTLAQSALQRLKDRQAYLEEEFLMMCWHPSCSTY